MDVDIVENNWSIVPEKKGYKYIDCVEYCIGLVAIISPIIDKSKKVFLPHFSSWRTKVFTCCLLHGLKVLIKKCIAQKKQ